MWNLLSWRASELPGVSQSNVRLGSDAKVKLPPGVTAVDLSEPGGAVRQKNELAAVLGIAPDLLRVLSHDVGGNFGTRNRAFVEFGLVLWASRKLGRPVRYTATRSETFLSDYQGRDLVTKVELALRKDGRFLAMRATNISNIGARAVSFSPLSKGSGLIPGSYSIAAATLRSMATFTNTMPTQAYRSSGRPEVTFAIERLIDNAAAELGMERISLRRRNLIKLALSVRIGNRIGTGGGDPDHRYRAPFLLIVSCRERMVCNFANRHKFCERQLSSLTVFREFQALVEARSVFGEP
jgi:hypothetical protein